MRTNVDPRSHVRTVRCWRLIRGSCRGTALPSISQQGRMSQALMYSSQFVIVVSALWTPAPGIGLLGLPLKSAPGRRTGELR